MTLAQRIAFPTPSAAQARGELRRQLQIKRARADMEKRHRRMAALNSNKHELKQLAEVARQEAPNKTDEAAWPNDITELADKIERETVRSLNALEAPVRDRDRQMLVRQFPAGIEAAKDDPAPLR